MLCQAPFPGRTLYYLCTWQQIYSYFKRKRKKSKVDWWISSQLFRGLTQRNGNFTVLNYYITTRVQLSIQSNECCILKISFLTQASLTPHCLGCALSTPHWPVLVYPLLLLAQCPITGFMSRQHKQILLFAWAMKYDQEDKSRAIIYLHEKVQHQTSYLFLCLPCPECLPQIFKLCTSYLCSTEPARSLQQRKALPPGPPSALLTRSCSRYNCMA